MRPIPLTTPDTLTACQATLRELRDIYWASARRTAQIEAELAEARERWARLKADFQDCERQGRRVDPLAFMREWESRKLT